MTGQKDRYSTTEKQWKIDDEQLTTPRHDEMVLSLLNKPALENICSLLKYTITDDRFLIRSELPITTASGFIIGYWDVAYLNMVGPSIYIEVKPTVDSFGKVLRQINTYRRYQISHKDIVVLYTDDKRFVDAFESQDVRVISP
jgi:hypothetical protein